MKKRVFIVHGWGGYPEYGWFPWLKKELEIRGFEVLVPTLPDADNPRIHPWVSVLADAVGITDEQTYFVGHSMGCQTIARYLTVLPDGVQCGGAVFFAGFFQRLTGLNDPNALTIEKHWLGTPFDLKKVKSRLPKSIAVFSDDDPYVPLENCNDFRDVLGSEIIIEHHQGHYSGSRDGTIELPIALECVLRIAL